MDLAKIGWDALTKGIDAVVEAFRKLVEYVKDFDFGPLVSKFEAAAEDIAGIDWAGMWAPLQESFGDIDMEDFAAMWDKLKEVMQPFIEIVMPMAVSTFESFKEALQPTIQAIRDDLMPALMKLGEALLPVLEAIGIVMGVVLVGQILIVLAAFKVFFEVLGVALPAAITVVSAAITAFATVLQTLTPIVTSVVTAVVGALVAFAVDVKNVWDDITGFITAFYTFLQDHGVIDAYVAYVKAAWELIKIYTETVWDLIKIVIETVLGVIQGIWDVWAGIFTGDWERVWNGVKQIFESVWEGIKAFIELMLDTFERLLTEFGPKALAAGKAIMQAIWDGLKEIGASALSYFENDFLGDMLYAASATLTKFYSFGENIIKGIINGIGAAWSGLVSYLEDKVGSLPGVLKKVLDILSPSRVMAEEVGEPIVTGIQKGFEDQWPAMMDVARGHLNELTDLVTTPLPGPIIEPPTFLNDNGTTSGGGGGGGDNGFIMPGPNAPFPYTYTGPSVVSGWNPEAPINPFGSYGEFPPWLGPQPTTTSLPPPTPGPSGENGTVTAPGGGTKITPMEPLPKLTPQVTIFIDTVNVDSPEEAETAGQNLVYGIIPGLAAAGIT